MLPYLKPKPQSGGVITTVRQPDSGPKEQPEDNHALGAAAADLIRAIHAKDEEHVALALRAAFDILDSQPHVEGPHTNEDEEE